MSRTFLFIGILIMTVFGETKGYTQCKQIHGSCCACVNAYIKRAGKICKWDGSCNSFDGSSKCPGGCRTSQSKSSKRTNTPKKRLHKPICTPCKRGYYMSSCSCLPCPGNRTSKPGATSINSCYRLTLQKR